MPDDTPTETDLLDTDIILDDLPEHVVASMERRDEWTRELRKNHDGLEAVITGDRLRWWGVGSTLRVAFLGGDTALHRKIERAVDEIEAACSIDFDFGFDEATGKYRRWSEDDTSYAAEIRISFDKPGYFSLVGRDSCDAEIGAPGRRVGGRPNQASLNLGRFDVALPKRWKGTVLHEFLHALGTHHEHVNPNGPCQEDFRWDDDPGYRPRTDARGRFIPDGERRPGIYTYLSGYPNFWPKAKVDHNLRPNEPTIAGGFDRESVMLYRFPSMFYRSAMSECMPLGNGQSLSEKDLEGLKYMYGEEPTVSDGEYAAALDAILSFEGLTEGPEGDSLEDRTSRMSDPGRWAMSVIEGRGL